VSSDLVGDASKKDRVAVRDVANQAIKAVEQRIAKPTAHPDLTAWHRRRHDADRHERARLIISTA
jgi:hypothetical protein